MLSQNLKLKLNRGTKVFDYGKRKASLKWIPKRIIYRSDGITVNVTNASHIVVTGTPSSVGVHVGWPYQHLFKAYFVYRLLVSLFLYLPAILDYLTFPITSLATYT